MIRHIAVLVVIGLVAGSTTRAVTTRAVTGRRSARVL